MKLTGQQIRQIQDALLGGFDRDGLRMFVRIRLNVELDAITHNDNLTVVVFDLIDWANQQGKVGDLIRTAAEERPDNANLQQLVKDYAQWEVAAAKDVTIGGNPQAIFSEAYRLQMAGELTRAQILYKEIENEPSLRLAVAEQLRAIDDELKHNYVDDHGVVNPELVIAGNPLPPIQGYASPEATPKTGKSWLRPMAASLATLLLVGGTAVVAMQQPAVRETVQQFAAAFLSADATPTLEPGPDESPTATVDAAGGRATPTATATEPVSTPTPPPTATETPRPRPPEAPPLEGRGMGNLVSEAQTRLIDVPSGGDVVLKVAELWIAPEGTPSDCASAFLALSWQVRAPYPGGDELDVRHLIPRGGGNSESLGQGASGQVTVGICDELTLRNSSLDDYRVQVRYAPGIY